MKPIILLITLLISIQAQTALCQETTTYKWWNPEKCSFPVIEGQGWPDRVKSKYDRLPKDAENKVRKEVWDISQESAGFVIRFRSNSSKILVHYGVEESASMNHMPATGKSGVDLYAKGSDNEWLWCKAKYSFGDTVKYDYLNIEPNDKNSKKAQEYCLYLPLYNKVKWLEIGVPEGASFEAMPLRREKPIVVYGTSITQGGCASRPGMAWTSILGRELDRPVINLGFSGNGRLEKELIDLMTEIDAKIYVLDCLANLEPGPELKNLILSAVKHLREKRPTVPILLVEHPGYGDWKTVKKDARIPTELNEINRQAYDQLKKEGVTQLYLLERNKINLNSDSFVDGVHPTDFGMYYYALAYEKIIRTILNDLNIKSSKSQHQK